MIFNISLPFIDPSEVSRKIVLQFKSSDFDIIECGIQILRDETNGNKFWESGNGDSDEEEASDKEDDKEGYESESGEASKEKDLDIGDNGDYESVSRKRPRETMMITNLKWGIKRLRLCEKQV